jgi:glutamyl-tRNA synthetase
MSVSEAVVTRFAPSPTGLLHLGNVRTALLNWLYARKHGGRFLLRFEDTDRDRSEKQHIDAIQNDLRWLGMDWDGEVRFQSEHHANHLEALQKLAEKGNAYRCFCSEHQLNLDRKLATSRGLPPRYSGRCRALSEAETGQRAESEPFVWRLAVHADEGEIVVRDALRGDVHFAHRDLDDPVVVRSDGTFTFMLPNAIDDAVDGITHVLRGDDHLTNSAYQVWLLERLGYAAPLYLHHGLLLAEDGSKLSKRTGSTSVAELREAGLFPEALVQAMVRLGHPNMPEDAHSLRELATHFTAEHVSTSAVRWSGEEMWRWHTRILHATDSDRLVPILKPYLPSSVADDRLRAFAELVRENLERASDAAAYIRLLDGDAELSEDAAQVMREAGESFFMQALELWQSDDTEWKAWVGRVKQESGRQGKGLFMPLRAALTGALHGPEMSHVISFLGEEGVRLRLRDAIRRLSA